MYTRSMSARPCAPESVRWRPSERNHGLPALQEFQSATCTSGKRCASVPITRDPGQTARFDAINGVVAQEVDKRPGGAVYLDTYSLLAAPNGGYAQYLTTLSGAVQDVRAPDGVHFSPAGADIVARQALKDLNEAYNLTSWRRRTTATR